MSLEDPYALDPYAPPSPGYWDDDLERQYQDEMAAQALPPPPAMAPPMAAPMPAQPMAPTDEAGALEPLPLSPDEEAQIEIDQPAAPPPEMAAAPMAFDATSGVDQLAPADAYTSTAPLPTDRPIEELTGEEQGSAILDLAQNNPALFRRYELTSQKAADDKRIAEMERIALSDRQMAENARRNHDEAIAKAQAARQQLELDATELAKAKVDPERWWSDRSMPQKIAGVLSAVIGGFAMNKTGRNIGVEMMNSAIDADIDAQKANIASGRAEIGRRQGVVAEMFAATGDLDRAAEAARRASKEEALQKLEIEMMKYDRNGTMYRQLGDQLLAGRAAMAADAEKHKQRVFDNEIKEGEYKLKVRAQNAREQAAKAKAQAAGAAKPVKFDDVPRTLDELRGMGVNIPTGVKLPPDAPRLSLNQAQDLAKSGKNAEDWNKAARENSPEEQARLHGVADLVDTSGKTIAWREPTVVAKAYNASDDALRLYDELIQLRKDSGASSDLMRSPAWRKASAKFAALMLNQKTRDELGALTGSDMELEAKKIGTSDPTEWRDPLPGLEEGRHNLVEGMNSLLRTQAPGGVKPKRWDPPRLGGTPAEKTVVDELGERLTGALYKQPITSDNPLEQYNAKISGAILAPLNKQTEDDLRDLATYARQTNQMGTLAKQYLRAISEKAVYPDARARAKAVLDKLPAAKATAEDLEPRARTGEAR
jgi:hypothetical protein